MKFKKLCYFYLKQNYLFHKEIINKEIYNFLKNNNEILFLKIFLKKTKINLISIIEIINKKFDNINKYLYSIINSENKKYLIKLIIQYVIQNNDSNIFKFAVSKIDEINIIVERDIFTNCSYEILIIFVNKFGISFDDIDILIYYKRIYELEKLVLICCQDNLINIIYYICHCLAYHSYEFQFNYFVDKYKLNNFTSINTNSIKILEKVYKINNNIDLSNHYNIIIKYKKYYLLEKSITHIANFVKYACKYDDEFAIMLLLNQNNHINQNETTNILYSFDNKYDIVNKLIDRNYYYVFISSLIIQNDTIINFIIKNFDINLEYVIDTIYSIKDNKFIKKKIFSKLKFII